MEKEATLVKSFDELCQEHAAPFDGDAVLKSLEDEMLKYDPVFKALQTTNSGPLTNIQRTSPLMLENLDGLMTEVLITEKHFKLFNAVPRTPSAGPYFEWNRHKGFGSRRGNLGFAEGGAPKGSVSQFQRNGIYNKYLGVKGGVTHQMLTAGQNGGTVEDPNTRENRDRALELFERLEREFIFGDKTIKDSNGNEVNWDGLLTLLMAQNAGNVIDKAGAPLTYTDFDDKAENLVKVGKQISVDGYTAYMSTHVLKGLNNQYKDKNIIREGKGSSTSATFAPGFKVPGYDTQFGFINFEPSILLEEVDGSTPNDAALADAPASANAPTGAASGTGNTLDVGTYYYKIGAYNDAGEALPSAASSGVAVTAGQKATLTITKVTGAVGYRIYRSTSSTGTFKWIGRVADSGSATTTWDDTGAWRTAGTNGDENGLAVLIKPDPRDIVLAQMAPLTKMPLPQVDTTYPFLLLLYCVLVLKAPERVMIFKNCGNYVGP